MYLILACTDVKRKLSFCLLSLLVCIFVAGSAGAQSGAPLRRPVSPQQPMWLIHIDSWNNPDPQKIIDMIPADIRPYVVLNISLSIGHDSTGKWTQIEYAYETIKSWLRTCSENRVWAMVQQSSGGFARLSDFDLSVYEELYRDYPCLIGFNYAEQFWGYDDPHSVSWLQRVAHFTDLLKLSNKYGGYLMVSWCGNQYSPNINPMAMLKRNPDFVNACKQYAKNYILCEKYTTQAYKFDMESLCLGTYLSGYSGNYGIRYDATGWSDSTGVNANFTMATAIAPYLEHAMLTGETVIDGPETIPVQQSTEVTPVTTTDGYTSREWQFFPQFYNVTADVFRKVLDGTVRIPSRQEVIDRSKIAIVHDINSGSDDNVYSTPQTLFDGLYRMDNDGTYQNNMSFFKKTGRYPTIPVIYPPADAAGNSFQLKVNNSSYAARWPTTADKVNEFNSLFPQEYTGDLYVGRNENGWVAYNPYKTNQIANATIPFKYNTCDSMHLSFSQYSGTVVKETSDQLKFYLNNYDNVLNTGLKTDIIKIYGSTSQPTWSFTDRASHQASILSADWSGGVFSLTVQHNGALDITVNCSGAATGRLTSYHVTPVIQPGLPTVYSGPRQYEAEFFDYKNIAGNVTNGVSAAIRNYTGEGYLLFGTNAAASIRETVNVPQPGVYQLSIKYSAAGGNVNTVDLLVNGTKVATPVFTQTASVSDWNTIAQAVTLHAGDNTVMLSANAAAANSINFDNIVISNANAGQYNFENDTAGTSAGNPPAYAVNLHSGTAGVVAFTDGNGLKSNVFKTYSNGSINGTGVADLDLFASTSDYSVTWKEYAGSAGGKKGILLRANGSSAYAAGMKQGYLFTTQNNADNTVTLTPYIAGSSGISPETAYTSSFSVAGNKPVWYRATAIGNELKFECSSDSITWEGGSTTAFTDNTYAGGTSQLLWGFGSANFSWMIDNITFRSSDLAVNKLALQGFAYAQGGGPSVSQAFVVTGRSLNADVLVKAPANYEVSLDSLSGYANTLTIARVADSIPSTNIYARLKTGLTNNTYEGNIVVEDADDSVMVSLSGSVTLEETYTFTGDPATTSAQDPPAANVSVGTGNGITAGVIAYTDAQNNTGNYLKVYGVGSSGNGTGVLNLDLFPSNSTDYSVTWKQAVPDSTLQYKNGVLLRGSGTGGYTQGIMQGYLFNASNGSPSSIAFRIFKSTSTGIGSPLVSTTVSSTLHISNNTPVWYRATVSGTSPVNLKFEYSTDSITWYTGTSYIDNTASFASGSTQYVSGLYSSGNEYYLDNITLSSTPQDAYLSVTEANPGSYTYAEGNGPSNIHSFAVSGIRLKDNLVVSGPAAFEISLDSLNNYSDTIVLPQSSGTVDSTVIYARMKSGLSAGNYQEDVSFSYASQPSVFNQVVVLRGIVSKPLIAVASSSSLNDLGYVSPSGTAIVRTFNVSGTGLSQNLNINAPANFEISLNKNAGYGATIALAPTNDTIVPTTVYVRNVSGLAAAAYNGDIAFTALGADSKSLSVSGVVTAQASVYVSDTAITGLGYSTYSNIPPAKPFTIYGNPLVGQVTLSASNNFEISRTINSGYNAAIDLPASDGAVDSTIVYVRLKSGLSENSYSGKVTITSNAASDKFINLSGEVTSSIMYDFTSDAAGASATTPPAQNMSVATGNTATAGVTSYTFAGADNVTSNAFRAYSGGNRNATGVIDLNLFPSNATDYSVTWKEAVGSANTDYKVGVLLRGSSVVGTDGSTGYVQGIRGGYLFIIYTAGSASTKHSEFRIYRSTSATSLSLLINNNAVTTLVPNIAQPVWYRASVSGTSPVTLTFEYSTDSVIWNTGAQTTDASADFPSGSTQLVWGLAAGNYNFYMDDISYEASPDLLPIGLSSFSVAMVNNTARLNWEAQVESNSKGFNIERSSSGNDFNAIGFVSSSGNTASGNFYNFTDSLPLKGMNYYRLKQINNDGSFSYSGIKSVTFRPKETLKVYPNPVRNILYVVSSNESGNLIVFDVRERAVLQANIQKSAKNSIDVSRLPAGIYFYRLNTETGSFIKR